MSLSRRSAILLFATLAAPVAGQAQLQVPSSSSSVYQQFLTFNATGQTYQLSYSGGSFVMSLLGGSLPSATLTLNQLNLLLAAMTQGGISFSIWSPTPPPGENPPPGGAQGGGEDPSTQLAGGGGSEEGGEYPPPGGNQGLSDIGYVGALDFPDESSPVTTTPEPSTMILLATGLTALMLMGLRRRKLQEASE